jgi:hypothetical protein
MYDNFSDREYALVDAYLAGTLQAEERSELNAAARNNAVLYEYIVLRKQLQYIGKQRSLVSAALLVQADLDLPMPPPAPKPHFVQYKFAYAGIAASFLAALGFFFWSQDFSLGNSLETLVADATVNTVNRADLKTKKTNTQDNTIATDANTNFDTKNNKNVGKNTPVKQKSASNNIFNAPVKQKSAPENIFNAPVKQKSAPENIFNAPVKQKSTPENILTTPENIFNAKSNVDVPKKWNVLAQNGVIGLETSVTGSGTLVTDAPVKATTEVSTPIKAVTETPALVATEVPAPVKSASSSVITYFKKHFPKKANGEQYVFNTATDTLFVTPQGTVIALPKNVFATTEPRLTLTVKEAYTYGDMLLHQLTTVADNDNLMETGGMLYLQATDKTGKEVPLKPNKTIKVQMPSTNLKADMQSFYQSKTDKAEVFENAAAWSAASAGEVKSSTNIKNNVVHNYSKLGQIDVLKRTVRNFKDNAWGSFKDNDCAVCWQKRFDKFNPLYYLPKKKYITGEFQGKDLKIDFFAHKKQELECAEYWNNPKRMKQEMDSLKNLYSTTNIKQIIKKQEMARRRSYIKVKTAEFYAYQRAFGFKDSTQLVIAVKTLDMVDRFGNNIDWNKYLIKYYKVESKVQLGIEIKKEMLKRDSIDMEDMMRFYNVKTAQEALSIHKIRTAQNELINVKQRATWQEIDEVVSIRKGIFYNNILFQSNKPQLQNSKNNNFAATAALNVANIDISELGWVNMDRFMGLPNLTALKPANPEKAHLVAIFKNYKCILGVSDDLNPYASSKGAPRVPRNEPITLIAYKVEGDKFFIGKIETTTSDAKTAPVMQEISNESLDKVLAGL